MGTVYPRGNQLWIGFYDPVAGKRVCKGTKYVVGQEAQARAALELIEEKLAAGAPVAGLAGPATVKSFFWGGWHEARKKRVSSWRNDETRFRKHVEPFIGHMALDEVRPKDLARWVEGLRLRLAPRTVRNVYALVSALYRDAVFAEVVKTSPCELRSRHLGKIVDKDPEWRAQAVFTPEEVVAITTDERVPEDRRVFYSILFYGGPRFGEVAALRWRDYDADRVPLGRIGISKSIHSVEKTEKSVKTERPRELPVHPVLAAVLADWKQHGWKRFFGRDPLPEDRIVPSRRGNARSVNHMQKKFHADLDRLGLRRRRQHDARRTFISVARASGARTDVLKWITHGPSASVIDAYTELPWPTLCEAMACVTYAAAPKPAPTEPAVEGGAEDAAPAPLLRLVPQPATPAATVADPDKKRARRSEPSGPHYWRGVGDSNPWPPA